MNRILILFAYPALQKSRINRVLISDVQDIEAVTFHDLYEAYPEFDILVPEEQVLLEAHDIINLAASFFLVQHSGAVKGVD
jgi:glutathione-regulated potassium-efflux system ancillary protein KefG